MPIGSFYGALLNDIEELTSGEIRIIAQKDKVVIIQVVKGKSICGIGKTLELAYAAYCRDRLRNAA